MIEEKYKLEILEIFNSYGILRDRLADFESLSKFLKTEYEKASQQLGDTRNKENSLINKIEKETGTRLSSQDLLEIIQSYEK